MSITMTTVILFAVFGVLLFLGGMPLHQHCGILYRDGHVHPVLGPDHLYHDAEDELRC